MNIDCNTAKNFKKQLSSNSLSKKNKIMLKIIDFYKILR